MLIGNCLARNARLHGGDLALKFEETSLSWAELESRTNQLGAALAALGATPGTAVASILFNSVELVETQLACLKAGFVYVPIMPGSVGREIGHILSDVGARFVVCDSQFAHELDDSVIALVVGSGDHRDYATQVGAAPADDLGVTVSPDAVAMIRYTSGTTGHPKGCIATHNQLGWAAASLIAQLPYGPGERGTISSPLSAGLAMATMHQMIAAGVSMFLLPKYDPANLLAIVARERITRIYAIETMFNALVRHPAMPETDLSSLRLVYGNSPGKDAADGFARLRANPTFQGRFYNAYGSTECGGSVVINMPDAIDAALTDPALAPRTESIGQVSAFCKVECRDESGRPVPVGEVGELAIFTPSAFSGYHNLPEATAEILRDGWLYTGDLARLDADGFVFLAGRKRDMIKSGGLNVYPAEVEGVLASHPRVEEAAVVGAPDDRWGEAVVAFVRTDGQCEAEDLAAWCSERLAGFKRPKQYRFVDSMPKGETGKILKRALRELLSQD